MLQWNFYNQGSQIAPALPFYENSPRFKLMVVAIVVMLHLMFYRAISYGPLPTSTIGLEKEGLRIRYIESVQRPVTRTSSPESQPALATTRSQASEAGKDVDEKTRADNTSARTSSIADEMTPATSNGPLVLAWGGGVENDPDFRPRILDNRVPASLAMNEPDTFRMRRKISGKDVIEGAAQLLGLWPPGYTTDPCPEIERSIGGLMTNTHPTSRELLNEELRKQQAFCR